MGPGFRLVEHVFKGPSSFEERGSGNGVRARLEGISLAGISGGQTDDDGVENGSERRWTG